MAEPIVNVLGTVAIKHCGEYDETIHYEKLNVVTYQGSSYCAKTDTTGNIPTNTVYWDLMVKKGDKGTSGDNGYTPIKGTDYYTAADKAELESTLATDVSSEVSTQLGNLTSASPIAVNTTASMTDTNRIYVLTTDGHWYWHNGTAWTDGGVYQATELVTDKTLTQDGEAADAEATGDEIERLEKYRIRSDFEPGDYNYSDGDITENNTDWRLQNYRRTKPIKIPAYSMLILTTSNIKGFVFDSYDNGVTWAKHNWLTKTNRQIIPTQDCLVCISLTNESGASVPTLKECHDNFYVQKPFNTKDFQELVEEDSVARIDYGQVLQGSFLFGGLSQGNITNLINRVVFSNYFKFDSDITIKAKSGFKFGVHTYVNGSFNTDSGWKTSYNVSANTTFRICIARQTEQTETEDKWFLDFVKSITIEPKDKIKPIPNISMNKAFMLSDKPKLMLHRGLQSEAPENSAPAFELAGQNGAWGIETDVYETSDGEFVCIHDDTVDRTTDGTGNVRDKTFAQIEALTIDVGSNIEDYPDLKIPTFEQYLQICKYYNCIAFIEIKGVTNLSGLIDLVRKYGMLYKSVFIVWESLLNSVRAIDEDAIVPCLLNGYNSSGNYENVINTAKKYPNVMVGLEAGENVTDNVIELAHENDIVVGVWTINNVSTAKSYITRGVDMITTNSLTDLN